MINIRNADPADTDQICRILRASIQQLCAADHGNDPELIEKWLANKTHDRIGAWIADPQATLLVAEAEGEPAGVGLFSHRGEILLNYVSPDHRFKGISRTLLAAIENALSARGLDRASLTSTETGHQFYLAAGWQDAGERVSDYGFPGWPMTKRLAP